MRIRRTRGRLAHERIEVLCDSGRCWRRFAPYRLGIRSRPRGVAARARSSGRSVTSRVVSPRQPGRVADVALGEAGRVFDEFGHAAPARFGEARLADDAPERRLRAEDGPRQARTVTRRRQTSGPSALRHCRGLRWGWRVGSPATTTRIVARAGPNDVGAGESVAEIEKWPVAGEKPMAFDPRELARKPPARRLGGTERRHFSDGCPWGLPAPDTVYRLVMRNRCVAAKY